MLLTSCFVLTLHLVTCVSADVHLYVSPQGANTNNGLSESAPMATIQHAVDIAHTRYANVYVFIELMAGYHDLQHSLFINRNKLSIRPYKNQEVHVTGGKRIDSVHFKHVTNQTVLNQLPAVSRSHVRVVHLPDVGVTDYGKFGKYGFGTHRSGTLEVFYNGSPLHFSQWPNEGFINIVEVLDGQNGKRFRYNSDVPRTWHQETDPWVYGYWYWSWADKAMKVASIDATKKIVTLTEPTQFGLRTGHWGNGNADFTKQGGYFKFVNILSALDEPGEYYMDTSTGNLYVWVQNSAGDITPTDVIYVSVQDYCILLNRHAKDIVIEGFTLEVCRTYGISGRDVTNVQIKQMEIRNTGSTAVSLQGDSRNCLVSQCLVYNTSGGVYITGGNRQTLESSLNTIENCEIHDFSRVGAVSSHAIAPRGVGHLVRNNHIYSGQYTGILYYGNDIIMENNLLHHLCVNASDCGAFHTGRDWTTRGNVIRYNIVHHVLRLVPGADCRGVMLDDLSSSTSITNNVFYDNHIHANIGGGRDNIISYNVMYNATKASIQVDHRGLTRFYSELGPRLHSMPYKSSVWTLRYPQMATLDSHNLTLPEGNQIKKNIVYNDGHSQYIIGLDKKFGTPIYFNVSQTGISMGKTDYYDVDKGDLRIKCSAATWANANNFPQVVSPNDVGPKAPPGPEYLNRGLIHLVNLSPHNKACTTRAPATTAPVSSYLPDGSRHNDLFNVSNVGCWLSIEACTDHPNAVGTYRDHYGESHAHAAVNETACLNRAVQQWRYCGSHAKEQVAAIYGPTGATTLAGDGCFMAVYKCPKHGGPADGHVTTGTIYRDTYAEKALNAAHNEAACLSRAHTQWVWCGSYRNHPVTSIYRPTGAIVTAGAGCWIHVQKCPNHPNTKSMFYDAWGATNYNTDNNEYACLHQADYYWRYCGSNTTYPVTAYYRPSTHNKTYP